MQRWGGAKSFPSMSSFRGDQPNKKPRLEEPSVGKNLQTNINEMDDEWGDDWDDTVIEDCMVIESTQMCDNEATVHLNNKPAINRENSSSSNQGEVYSSKNKVSNNNYMTNNKNQNISGFSIDSGFIDSRSNNLKSDNSIGNNFHGNNATNASYKTKFTDFASSSQSSNQKFSRPTPIKRNTPTKNQSSSKSSAYNSIPIKGLSEPNGDSIRDYQMQLDSIRIEKKKLEEEVLVKQGQVSLLKAELLRKEKALEAERLDRCAALEASDFKVKEKVVAAAEEANKRMKNVQKKVEKLESDLHFKDREIQELTHQVKSLKKKQSSSSGSHPPNSPSKRTSRTENSVSPGSTTSFASKFDFGGLRVSTGTKETQTDLETSKIKRRTRLKLSSTKGQNKGSSDFSYMMSGSIGRTQSIKAKSVTKYNEADKVNPVNSCSNDNITNVESSMPAEWSDLLAQMVNIPISESNSEHTNLLKSRLFSLATDRIKEVQLSLLTDDSKSSAEDDSSAYNILTLSPEQWYLNQMTPALSILRTTSDKKNAQCALRYLVNHLSPIIYKEVTVNKRIGPILLETMEKVIRNSHVTLDDDFCELFVSSVINYLGSSKSCCENITMIVDLLYSLADQVLFNNLLCSMRDGCLISQLCIAIQKEKLPEKSSSDGNNLSWHIVAWLSELLKDPPAWLINGNCICPQELLNTLLELILKSNVVFNSLKPGISSPYGSKLLLKCLQVIHSWAVADLYFHDKYISLPLLFNLIKTIKQPNKQTVDIMADLYSSDTLREYLESEGLIDSDTADEEM